MNKRAYGVFIFLMLFLAAAVLSISRVSGGAEYVAAARGQSVYRLDVAKSRGMIYDCDLSPIAGGKRKRVAAVAPTIETIGALEKATGGRCRDRLAAALEDGKPFLLELEAGESSTGLAQAGIDVFSVPVRYAEDQLAPHIVGYLDSLGSGASGIELAMNDALEQSSGEAAVYYQVDALGRAVAVEERKISDTLRDSRGGVALTLDSRIQKLAQEEGAALGKGAVVVTEVPGCQIRAAASFPSFSPTDLGAAAEEDNGALLDRAFCAYAPGSVFKLVTAAARLESGSPAGKYTCTGAVNAGGLLFHCYGGKPHGELDLQEALEQSCNCYFINTARSLGGQSVLNMAYNLGLGNAQEFGRGLFTQPGILPQAESLENSRALANFAFGQGETTVTPVQMCALVNAVVSGGVYSSPKLILGTVDKSLALTTVQPVTDKTLRVMSVSTAGKLRTAMEGAVKSGTAQPGAPSGCVAGAKTGTAQTGVYENGQELLHFWYCGYVCDENGPRYCITVLKESAPEGGDVAARVFQRVAQGLAGLE